MKRLTPNGFTLVEMVVVIAVVIILAAFSLGLAAHFNRRGYELKTLSEIHTVQVACDAFRNDQGAFPQNADTDALDPRVDANPAAPKYQKASLYLYSSLTGDSLPAGAPDGRPESGNAVYLAFKPKQLAYTGGTIGGAVAGIQDPFGGMYGYSTAAS